MKKKNEREKEHFVSEKNINRMKKRVVNLQ